jgi:DNA-binding CsgD family transcriptional regulator
MILEVLQHHVRPREHVRHGQALWMAVDVNDPPTRGKTIAQTNLVPVVLDLHTAEDTRAIVDRKTPAERLRHKAVRLSRQAYAQGALLSNCDLAALLGRSDQEISKAISEHERATGQIVPRRATIHDYGSGLTHKRIICLKRYRDGKPADEVAKETYHSLEAVDRYLGQYDRVRHCRMQGLSAEQTAYTLSCSPSLVREYLAIDDELEPKHD